MQAAFVGENGLEIGEVARPEPKPHEILVRVRTAALNRADLAVAAGASHGAMGGAGTIPGLEFAGEIEAMGSDVTGWKIGDRVMCTGAGGYAQYAVTDHLRALPMPDGFDFDRAATLPLALQTMHNALVDNGGLAAGDTVMILGASSGVGLMGQQIARHLGARVVIGTSTDDARRARLTDFGAHHAVDTRDSEWPDRVRALTDGGVDLIIDQISGPLLTLAMHASAVRGRIVNVGRLGGGMAEFDCDLHALKRIRYIGVTFRTRSIEEIRAIVAGVRRDLWPAICDGTLHLPIDRSFALAEAREALEHMRANRHFGKILLQA
ncbi:MAG: zinc-binding dehydrogenase [Salinarimonas sp.]|nr:zinc-binding dehydrogenase [Salinarimonas sp.]